MSEITTIYEGILTKLASLYPSHRQLTNPYELTDNPDPELRQGYGLGAGSGSNTERYVTGKTSVVRSFNIILTRIAYAADLNVTGKDTAIKQLLEDHHLLINESRRADGWDLTGDYTVLKSYVTDDGVFSIKTEEGYYGIQTTLNIEYHQDIT